MLTKQSTYNSFTTISVVDYLKQQKYIHENSLVECEEIGDGNLNYVFRVKETETGRTLIVKQALPYAKVVGESWPLTLDRARIEGESLKLAAKFVPELVPGVYGTDDVAAATVMEDLSAYTLLRKGLIEGERYPNLAEHIGRFIAHTLFHTSDFGLEPSEKKVLATKFVNPELCKITEDLVFTDPFFDHETNEFPEELLPEVEALWNDDELKLEAAKLKQLFLTKSEALIHGDLHTGSIFVTRDSSKVIDPEFGFFGPIGFDVGAFFANLILNHLSQEARIEDEVKRDSFQDYLIQVIVETWEVFTAEFTKLWVENGKGPFIKVAGYLDYVLRQILQDAVGFAGNKIIRRTIGLAKVEDINGIEDKEKRLEVQRRALKTGRHLIVNRSQVSTVQNLIQLVKGD
ncbi:S-methyl-5-thioribose kinase [Pseudalkalibacillus decolorationis]|uniref:S-methyl-5-thioribose kinase n=1 Tax=Pseudalkalibacillus decolorationis TaxID=163879 RepID=UPI002147C3A3|nr:S-methyl-5-thioribose kinase [Pseudalkalibacillus decolorationis]